MIQTIENLGNDIPAQDAKAFMDGDGGAMEE